MTQIFAAIAGVCLTAIIALNAWSVKALIELKTSLVGIDGRNGISSRVRRLEHTVYNEPND